MSPSGRYVHITDNAKCYLWNKYFTCPVSSGMAILTQRHTTQCLYKPTQEQNNVTHLYSIIKEQVTTLYITVLLYYN